MGLVEVFALDWAVARMMEKVTGKDSVTDLE
jgi:hypothetical protein